MAFTTLEELNEVLILNPTYKYAELQLDNYLILEAISDEAEDFLTRLEMRWVLPFTVAWFSQEARKVRLYQRAKRISSGLVDFSGLFMSIRTGPDIICLVASPFNRLRDYNDLGDESLLENAPAALNKEAVRLLTSLLFINDSLLLKD
jgi:hypothetical protein